MYAWATRLCVIECVSGGCIGCNMRGNCIMLALGLGMKSDQPCQRLPKQTFWPELAAKTHAHTHTYYRARHQLALTAMCSLVRRVRSRQHCTLSMSHSHCEQRGKSRFTLETTGPQHTPLPRFAASTHTTPRTRGPVVIRQETEPLCKLCVFGIYASQLRVTEDKGETCRMSRAGLELSATYAK